MKISFQLNRQKSIEALLYVLSKRDSVNLYNVMKIFFEADRFHLNKYGRPVTGDTYIKMDHGTVPSAIHNMAKNDEYATKLFGATDPLPITYNSSNYLVTGQRAPNLDYLSESDIEALDTSIEKYMGLTFGEVRDLNHQEKCWNDAEMNQQIDFESIIEDIDLIASLQSNPLKLVI